MAETPESSDGGYISYFVDTKTFPVINPKFDVRISQVERYIDEFFSRLHGYFSRHPSYSHLSLLKSVYVGDAVEGRDDARKAITISLNRKGVMFLHSDRTERYEIERFPIAFGFKFINLSEKPNFGSWSANSKARNIPRTTCLCF